MKALHIVLKRKKQVIKKKYNQNNVRINGSCAFVYLKQTNKQKRNLMQMIPTNDEKTHT